MEAAKGAPVEENGKGAEGAAGSDEEMGEVASEKGKAVEEAKEVAGVKTITLQSADGVERCVSAVAAELSMVLSGTNACADTVIPLPNVATGKTLDTVIEYCIKHAAEPIIGYSDPSAAAGSSSVGTLVSEDLEKWDRKLVEGLSADDLHDLLIAANYLGINGLLDVVCQKAADMIKGKTTQQIRDTFNLTNDLTPADEAELRQLYAWAFDE
ncbi:hypothetical protein GQ55_2G440300 [Panicum hallii var. hallii]|uniref:SKP1-like protein n=1 Tax=Panicum hallii var. hallii TaxID=1504633 RepID=A0A2T7EYV0_9POAL|nr:hypothetical protein GQ55_2G440300 [Panicum hallii var. hallii]